MVMVKLKMRMIYKSFLTIIGFLIVVATILGVLYFFYDKVNEIDSDIEVAGNLSINYIDGKNLNIEEIESIKFSVTNSGDNIIYYNVGFMQVRGTGYYKLLYNNTVITEGELKSIDEITTDYISLDIGETKLFTLEITNTGNDILKGKLNIRTLEGKITTFANTIIENNKTSENTLTKVGDDAAVENEGLIKSSDDIGVSYYFRGNVTNNYVKFGDMLWRIVRINGDGTVRLILDNVTDVISSYYTSENPSVIFKESNIKKYLDNWLIENIKDEMNYIANTKYCSDIGYDEGYNYYSYARIMTNKIPTLNCLGTSFSNNIGLLTIDEVILAGASPTISNTSYYLYNSEIKDSWYTMSGAMGNDTSTNMFMISTSGNIETDITGDLYRNVRPVINLIKNIQVEGNGTKEDPYIIVTG